MHKQGTPTMGGLAIVAAALTGWLAAHIRRGPPFSDQAMIVWVVVLAMALMGFLDDYIKVKKRHNRGILWKRKNYVTMLMSFGAAWWLVAATGISETISLTRAEDLGFAVPQIVWIIWAGLIIWATTNAVNVTDGLDGLAGGSALMGFGAFTIIAYWAFRNPELYTEVVNPLDMGVFAAAFAGACLGFLWWNAAPARIIMGDVGALGDRLGAGVPRADARHPPAAALDLWHQRDGGRIGRRSDGSVQGVRTYAATVPHVADPPPLRAPRMAGDNGHHPVLADLRDLRRVGAGDLHRRLHTDRGGVIMRSLVYGLAVTGASTVRALARRGHGVVVIDDHIDDAKRDLADELGVELLPTPAEIDDLVAQFDLLSPSPGVPETHAVIAAARRHDVPVRSEIELAYQWEQDATRRRSTDPRHHGNRRQDDDEPARGGHAHGRRPAHDRCRQHRRSARRRARDATRRLRRRVQQLPPGVDRAVPGDAALWLNLAPDHLNWHRSTTTYEAAKARLFDLQRPSDVAVGFVDDPIVMRHLDDAPARHVTFGRSNADYHLAGDALSRRAARSRWSTRCVAGSRTTSPTPWRRRRS